MKRGGSLKRYTRLAHGPKRLRTYKRLRAKGGHLFRGERDTGYLSWLVTLPCVMRGLSPCWQGMTPHHTAKQSHEGNDPSACTLCVGHHNEVDRMPGSEWRKRYPGLDLAAIAAQLYADYRGGR